MFLQISFSFLRTGTKNNKSNEMRSIGPFPLFLCDCYDEIFDVVANAHVPVSWNIDKLYGLVYGRRDGR